MYLALFLLSLVAVYLLLQNISNKRSSYYVVLFVLIAIVCLAYFSYSIANDIGMALVAHQFTFFDATFVMMFFLYCVLDICGFQISKKLVIPHICACLFFLGIAFTTGKHNLLYSDYWFETYEGSSHLAMSFGPLYVPFIIFVVINTFSPIFVVIYSYIIKKKISFRYIIMLGSLEIMIFLLYFIQMVVGLDFDILPCGYVMMEYVILFIIHRIALYDGSQIVIYNSEKRREYGYIIFDNKKAYVGSNDMARYFFPELNELDIDRQVKDGFIKTEFVDKLDNAEAPSKIYQRNDRMIMCTIKPYVQGKKQRVYGYIVELRDDTEQQEFIQTLNVMNNDLEAAVESANRANNAKSDFLASMSHEIRTPINAVLGMNEIALRECNDENIIAYLKDINNAGHNLLYIINDILDFSKIEAGKIILIDGDYSIVKLIKDVSDMVLLKAAQKSLILTVNVDKELPKTLNGDENRIRQIVVNLLNNAVKYTHKGTIELNFGYNMHYDMKEVQEKSDDKIDLIISVKDTGIGIREENIPYLFDSFQRVDETRNKNIEGTGLGLAITKSLVEMMGGSISVESEYGKGSIFTVVIPQKVVDKTPTGDYDAIIRSEQKKKEERAHIDASNVDILVVDDNKVNLQVAKGLLKPTKAKVTLVNSGKECLDIIREKHFDIILLDHMMPDLDGIDTLHQAKKLEGNKCEDSAYIALTANAIAGVRDMYINEGFDDYISKPIDSEVLESMILKYS